MAFAKKLISFSLSLFLTTFSVIAMEDMYEIPDNKQTKHAIAMFDNLETDNKKFVHEHGKSYFEEFKDKQEPRLTLVMCVDSRCHHHSFDKTPDNDIFMVRNLSGQFSSSKGSISYGVKHLHTPLLIVMGHDDCGAVTAQTKLAWIFEQQEKKEQQENIKKNEIPKGRTDLIEWRDEIKEDTAITEELREINLLEASLPPTSGGDGRYQERFKDVVHQNIKFNIHKQVDKCLEDFHSKVRSGELIIAGALYDFQNRELEGHGRLIWIDARTKDNVDLFIKDGKLKENEPSVKAYLKKSKEGSIEPYKEDLPRMDCKNEGENLKYEEDRLIYKVHKSIGSALKGLFEKKEHLKFKSSL